MKTNIQDQGLQSRPEQVGTNTNAKRGSVYDQITERVISLLEQGTIPWQKPWKAQTGLPRNLVSKKAYRGINIFLLLAMNYESPFWLTFNQVKQLGGNVRKGEKACPVVFWKQTTVEDKKTGEKEELRLLRFYYVFNIVQCDGLKNLPSPSEQPFGESTSAAEIVANMPQRPEIKFGMRQAFYSPSGDYVGLPFSERFADGAKFYSVAFHELVHSTGHQSRLNRPTLTEKAGFGSDPYCKEELIAEMGAAFLCGQAGITDRTIDNSAAYLANWLEQLKNDRTLIISAAAQAQKAADFILGTRFDEAPSEQKETATA